MPRTQWANLWALKCGQPVSFTEVGLAVFFKWNVFTSDSLTTDVPPFNLMVTLQAMSTRIVFWPYDHHFLADIAGTGDSSFVAEIDRLASAIIEYDPDGQDSTRRSQSIAESVINDGFPSRTKDFEDEHHRLAVDFLIRPSVVARATTSNDFRYFDLIDSFDSDFFAVFPELESVLVDGRPWFGSKCPDEETYGTLTRDEVRRLRDRCKEFRSHYNEPEWEIDPLIEVFQRATDNDCDIWFAI